LIFLLSEKRDQGQGRIELRSASTMSGKAGDAGNAGDWR